MINKKIYALLIAFSLLFEACGAPTEQDVINQYQTLFDEKKEQLIALASSLPNQEETVEEKSCPELNPPLSMYTSKPYNTGILMEEQLSDPHAVVGFSITSESEYIKALQYTDHSLEWVTYEDSASEDFHEIFDEVLSYEYLIVSRINTYSEPFLIPNTNTYIPGEIDMDIFLTSLKSGETLCNFHIYVSTDEDVSYQYTEGEDGSFEADTALKNSLKADAFTAITEEFEKMTGARIKICEGACFSI